MEKQKINPEKITKPIQLLAVWFTGLTILVAALLTGASTISTPIWIPAFLAVSTVAIIPVFLIFIFLLQTKYRPQMQEDEYYYRYLDAQTNRPIQMHKDDGLERKFIRDEPIGKVSELFEKQKKQLQELRTVFDSLEVNLPESADLVIEAAKETTLKLEDTIEKKDNAIYMNSVLTDYFKIKSALEDNGFIMDEETFGNDELKKLLIGVGENINPKYLSEVIHLLQPFHFDLIELVTGVTEARFYTNRIILGSYAYESYNRNIKKLDSSIIQSIKNASSLKELRTILR